MKLNFSHLAVLAAAVLMFSSCRVSVDGDNENVAVVTSVVKTNPFEKIHISGDAVVHYTQGKSCSVKISGTQKQIERAQITSDGETLSIGTDNDRNIVVNIMELSFNSETKSPELYITSPDIIEVTTLGCSEFYADSLIDTDNFKLLVKGTGEIFLHDVICDNVQMEVEGTGNIDVDNITTQRANMQVKGTGNCEATIFNARRVDCSLTGTGNIDVTLHNCGTVSATLGGTGNIELKGDVRRVNKHQSGIGDIDTEELKVIE